MRDVFEHGDYVPLRIAGDAPRLRCSRSRGGDGSRIAVTCVPRLVVDAARRPTDPPLGEASGATPRIELPRHGAPSPLRDVFTEAAVDAQIDDGRRAD